MRTDSDADKFQSGMDDIACLTADKMEDFLGFRLRDGYSEKTVELNRMQLKSLYNFLADKKEIADDTLSQWRESLRQYGYSAKTINGFVATANFYLAYMGHREYQLLDPLSSNDEERQGLTRSEYLRLLKSAREKGKEKEYLQVKSFGVLGLTTRELPNMTVDAITNGRIPLGETDRSEVEIPAWLQIELSNFADRNEYQTGPLFRNRNGDDLNRTTLTRLIRRLCKDAYVSEDKGNPQCIRQLYQSTGAKMADDITDQVDRTLEQLMEQEQFEIGWNAPFEAI